MQGHTRYIIMIMMLSAILWGRSAYADETLPSEKDITSLSENACWLMDRFMQSSAKLRLKYNYAKKLTDPAEASALISMAEKTSSDLQKKHDKMVAMIKTIEDYQGDDWDLRYGNNGLWAAAVNYEKNISLFKCRANYYKAIFLKGTEKEDLIRDISNTCRTLGPKGELLRAKSIALLSGVDPKYKEAAIHNYDALIFRKGISKDIYIKAELSKYELLDPAEKQLDQLIEKVSAGNCANDVELNIKLAFLKLRFQDDNPLKAVTQKWPDTKTQIGNIILETSDTAKLNEKTETEILLAMQAICKENAETYIAFARAVQEIEKFQRAAILYRCAKILHSSDPRTAADCYLRSAKMQHKKIDLQMEDSAAEAADKAARLSYEIYYNDPDYCPKAVGAMEFYHGISSPKNDPELEYLLTKVLFQCESEKKAITLLKDIVTSKGPYALDSAYDLAIYSITKTPNDPKSRAQAINILEKIINAPKQTYPVNPQVSISAGRLYCGLLLEDNKTQSCKKVLAMLESRPDFTGQDFSLAKTRSLYQLQEYARAVKAADALDFNASDGAASLAAAILARIVEDLEDYYFQQDGKELIKTAWQVADRCADAAHEQWEFSTQLLKVELAIVEAENDIKKLNAIEPELLQLEKTAPEAIEPLRCRARWFMAAGQYIPASQAWSKIARGHYKENSDTQNEKWWRAKYYTLLSMSKDKTLDPEQVIHAIEVLQAVYKDIPNPWHKRITEIQKH